MLDIDINFNPDDSQVRLFLCKPDRTTIAELVHIKDRKLVENYGGINQLSFSVPYKITNATGKTLRNPIIELIRGDYLMRIEKGSEIDYFIISNPENSSGSNGEETKSVVCHQQQYEWKDKLVRLFNGTKLLYNPIGADGVLNETLLSKTDWTVSYVDSSLTNKKRTFDESQSNLLEFIYNSVERYGDYIPIVNTVNKTVSIYLNENVGVDEGLEITYGKYLKGLTETENFDDICTRLYIYGKDDMSINRLTPSGTEYLESFDFYLHGFEQDASGKILSHSPYMSDELCQAIIKHKALIDSKTTIFNNLSQDNNKLHSILGKKKDELTTLNKELKVIEDSIDIAIARGESLSSLNSQKEAKETQISSKKAEIEVEQGKINAVEKQINELRTEISIPANFTPKQIIERNRFIKEKVWQDSNYTSVEDLLEEGKRKIAHMNQPIVSYKVDSVDFISALNVNYDKDKLKLGSIVTIFYPNFNINIKAKIIAIDHDIDGNSIQFTIANTKDIKSGFLKIKDLLQRSFNTSTQIDMSKYKWDLSESNKTEIDTILNSAWDANKRAIEAGSNENYTLDRRGLTLKDPTDPKNFLRGLHNVLAFTNDEGNTYKNALSPSGLHAEVIIGKLIAGSKLTIQNSSGTFNVNGDGVTLDGMALKITGGLPPTQLDPAFKDSLVNLGKSYNGVIINNEGLLASNKKTRVIVDGAQGFLIEKNTGTENSPAWRKVVDIDSNGDLSITGKINATSGNFSGNITASGTITGGTFSGANITNGAIVGSSINVNNKFLVDKNGTMTSTGANISGNINMTGGTISWSNINSDPLASAANSTANTALSSASNAQVIAQKIADGTYTGGSFISGKQIYSPNITGGSITSNTTINVGTDVTVGNSINLTGNRDKSILFNGVGGITFKQSGNIEISSLNGINLYGIVGMSSGAKSGGSPIVTEDWIRRNPIVAKFG